MATEREHKYLVKNSDYKAMASGKLHITQGYLCREPQSTVRVRIADDRGFLTIKGENRGDTRAEYEYQIPVEDARAMLALCQGTVIDKTRYLVEYKGHLWEVDEFHGSHAGLVVAEIELSDNTSGYELPPFVGNNVTGDPRYYNSNL